ncbi:protein turtle-like isoform X2 [Boleophthalmus pectinirostris]|uniref:protein turtle-like isoform X2 n=1 Tax=Boleophthalmus pectinirostris TaxID=150288 RepID=UPI0024312680|nr:protein turtle-like isoform X2 [Boleophthalmus pectinirostris]
MDRAGVGLQKWSRAGLCFLLLVTVAPGDFQWNIVAPLCTCCCGLHCLKSCVPSGFTLTGLLCASAMELSLLYLSLLLLPVSAEVLKVEPDLDQFFSRAYLTLWCEGKASVKRIRTGSDQVQSCGDDRDFGVIRGSSCVIRFLFSSASGLYWCESAAGLRGPQRPLSVTDLILDGPALPVTAGSDITLRCWIRPGPKLSPVLVKDGSVVHNGSDWSFTVSKEHEGEYTCKDQTTGAESERRSLRVTESPGLLKVEPDSDQFLSGEIISLTCEEQWSVKRNRTGSDQVQSCGRNKDFGFISESRCVIFNPSPSSASGLYWCESAAGLRGPQRPLSVTDRLLILDGPALPVTAGSDITLRCRTRTRSGLSPVLVKDGSVVHSGSDWSFTVSKEHEGEYTCKDQTTGAESERRSLRVTERENTPAGFTVVLLGALGGLVLFGLVLGLVLVFLRRRRTQTGSDPESVDVTYADVTVRRAERAPPPGRHEEETVYSGVKTRPKGPEEVTYGEVTIKPNDKKKKRKREDPNGPWSDPDVVYSSVRTRGSGGAHMDPH